MIDVKRPSKVILVAVAVVLLLGIFSFLIVKEEPALPKSTKTYIVTRVDNGKTYHLNIGDLIEVELPHVTGKFGTSPPLKLVSQTTSATTFLAIQNGSEILANSQFVPILPTCSVCAIGTPRVPQPVTGTTKAPIPTACDSCDMMLPAMFRITVVVGIVRVPPSQSFFPTQTFVPVTSPPPSSPIGSIPPISNGTLTITSADNNTTQYMTAGNFLDESTPDSNSGMIMSQLTSSNTAVVKLIDTATGTGSIPVTVYEYEAVGAGTTTMTGSLRPNCTGGMACPQIIMLFRMIVVVTGQGVTTSQ